jgi:putative endonuclease
MYYPYVLLSEKDGRFYTGCANDLRKRVRGHETGCVRSTTHRRPLSLIYYEACVNRDDALRRERFLKSGKGKRFLRLRLARFLELIRRNKLERH